MSVGRQFRIRYEKFSQWRTPKYVSLIKSVSSDNIYIYIYIYIRKTDISIVQRKSCLPGHCEFSVIFISFI